MLLERYGSRIGRLRAPQSGRACGDSDCRGRDGDGAAASMARASYSRGRPC